MSKRKPMITAARLLEAEKFRAAAGVKCPLANKQSALQRRPKMTDDLKALVERLRTDAEWTHPHQALLAKQAANAIECLTRAK